MTLGHESAAVGRSPAGQTRDPLAVSKRWEPVTACNSGQQVHRRPKDATLPAQLTDIGRVWLAAMQIPHSTPRRRAATATAASKRRSARRAPAIARTRGGDAREQRAACMRRLLGNWAIRVARKCGVLAPPCTVQSRSRFHLHDNSPALVLAATHARVIETCLRPSKLGTSFSAVTMIFGFNPTKWWALYPAGWGAPNRVISVRPGACLAAIQERETRGSHEDTSGWRHK